MSDWSWLVPLPVVLPLSGAGLTLALYRRPRVQRIVSVTVLVGVLVAAATLAVLADRGPLVAEMGSWATPVGISLVADRLSTLMLTVSAVVVLCVLVYSLAQDQGAGEAPAEAPPPPGRRRSRRLLGHLSGVPVGQDNARLADVAQALLQVTIETAA